MLGRTIRIYLDNGSVTGIKHAEIVNWSGQAISVPRNLIKDLKEWTEAQRPGVYFLFGLDNEGNDAAYIGESEIIFDRLVQHIKDPKKEFWTEAIFFTSKDENLTKAHVKYLESRLTFLAIEVNRYNILNCNNPVASKLPRGDQDSMEEFIQNIKTLMGAMSHKILEQIYTVPTKSMVSDNRQETSTLELSLNIKDNSAKALLTNEGIVVKRASNASLIEAQSLSIAYKKLRETLQADGILILKKDKLFFTQDYLFKSPNQAAQVIVGYSINARIAWKLSNGTSLKDFEISQLTVVE